MVHRLHRVGIRGFDKGLDVESVEAVLMKRSGVSLSVPPLQYPPPDIGLSSLTRRVQEDRRAH